MNIQFSGVTHYRGPEDKVSDKLDSLQEADISTLTARMGGEGVALSGADSDKFLKDEFDVDVPQELKGKGRDEVIAAINENPDKYMPFVEKLQEAASDVFGLIDKVFNYFETAKENGDAEGNPVKEQLV